MGSGMCRAEAEDGAAAGPSQEGAGVRSVSGGVDDRSAQEGAEVRQFWERLVVAHMGMPEYDAFLGFAEQFANVHVDTTMCFVDSFGSQEQLGRELAPRLAQLRDKVVFGADFPNIPHDYAHQLEVLARLDLGDDWLRAVCWDNGARLVGGVVS